MRAILANLCIWLLSKLNRETTVFYGPNEVGAQKAIIWRDHARGRAYAQVLGSRGAYWRDPDHEWAPMSAPVKALAWACYFEALEQGRLPRIVPVVSS